MPYGGVGQVLPPTPRAGAEPFHRETSGCVWPDLVLTGEAGEQCWGDGPEGGPWGPTSRLPPQPPPSELVEGTFMSKDWSSKRGGRLLASSFPKDDLLDPARRTGLQLVSLQASRVLPTYLIYPHDTPEK